MTVNYDSGDQSYVKLTLNGRVYEVVRVKCSYNDAWVRVKLRHPWFRPDEQLLYREFDSNSQAIRFYEDLISHFPGHPIFNENAITANR